MSRPKKDAEYDPSAPIPQVIPKVLISEDGEPIIAREEMHHPSPVPRSLAIVLLVLAAISFGYNAVQQVQRNDENIKFNRALQREVTQNKLLLDQYAHQQQVINANEQRLEDLVLAISTAKTPREVTLAIQAFLKSSAQAKRQEQQYQQDHQDHQGYHSSAYTTPAPNQSSGSQTSPSPRPTRSSSPRPTPSGSHSLSPATVCVAGLTCVTPTPIPVSNPGTAVTVKVIPTPVTKNNPLWYGFAGITAFTVGTLHLVYGSHPDPLQSGIGAHAPNRKERV